MAMAAAGPGAVAVSFARRLRRGGLDVPIYATVTFSEALGLIGVADRDSLYWAGRSTLVHRAADLATYDTEFARFFDGLVPESADDVSVAVAVGLDALDGDDPGDPEAESDDQPEMAVRFSATEVLAEKDFAHCTADELAELHRAITRLRVSGPIRRSRRRRPTPQRHGRVDLRRTLKDSLHTGGDPIHLRRTIARNRPRRLVLLVDVSGSMAPYARLLVRFAHAATTSRRHVEVFALGTRTTRLTRVLEGHDPDQALAAAAAEVTDWSGGTRLGEGVARFNDRWGARGMARGATVVILSDGWDRGDPERLGTELARLARVAHSIIWVNPLAGAGGYTPSAGGMAAALPHIDLLVSGHSLASLEALAGLLTSTGRDADRSEVAR